MKHFLCLGLLLAGLTPGCSAPSVEKTTENSAEGIEVSMNSQGEVEDRPAAVLTVSLAPLRDGLAASAHQGPGRGVRRILKGPDVPSAPISTATARRSPAVFEERSEVCPACGLLEATVEIDFGSFSPPLGTQGVEPLGTGSVHVAVPVRAEAARSMNRPGWWEVRLVRDPAIPSTAEWVGPPEGRGAHSLSPPLIALGLVVAEAEASMLPPRAPLLELHLWPGDVAPYRVEEVSLRLSKRLVELQLFVGPGRIQEQGASASSVVVLGSEFQLMVSPELAKQLGRTEDGGQLPVGRGSIERVLLSDARGRLGRVVYSGPSGEGHLFSGSFTRSAKEPALPQKPRRPGTTGRLPRPRLR